MEHILASAIALLFIAIIIYYYYHNREASRALKEVHAELAQRVEQEDIQRVYGEHIKHQHHLLNDPNQLPHSQEMVHHIVPPLKHPAETESVHKELHKKHIGKHSPHTEEATRMEGHDAKGLHVHARADHEMHEATSHGHHAKALSAEHAKDHLAKALSVEHAKDHHTAHSSHHFAEHHGHDAEVQGSHHSALTHHAESLTQHDEAEAHPIHKAHPIDKAHPIHTEHPKKLDHHLKKAKHTAEDVHHHDHSTFDPHKKLAEVSNEESTYHTQFDSLTGTETGTEEGHAHHPASIHNKKKFSTFPRN